MLILDYIDSQHKKKQDIDDGNNTTSQLRRYLQGVNAQEFVNTLHLFCWQFITSSEFSVLDMNEIPIKQVISEVLQKIATTKGGLIRNLVKIFDELMTFENIEMLETLIEVHSEKNIGKEQIIQLKRMPSVIKNSDCFDGVLDGQTASFNIKYKKNLRFKKVEDPEQRQMIQDLFDKLVHKTSFLKDFIYSMIVYFIQFLGVSEETREDMHDIIDEANNKIMFSYSGNIRSICLYLKKMLNFDRLEVLEGIQFRFKLTDITSMGDVQILIKEIEKKKIKQIENFAAGGSPRKTKEWTKSKKGAAGDTLSVDQGGFGPDMDMEIDEVSGRATIHLLHSKVFGVRDLNKDLVDFAKKFDKCETQGLYYSIEIINKINYWIYQNFGACEREVQIDIIRVILRKTNHPDVINHLLLLNEICMKNTLDLNQFFQLFLACLDNDQILFETVIEKEKNQTVILNNFPQIEEEDEEEVDIDEFLTNKETEEQDDKVIKEEENGENKSTRETVNTKKTDKTSNEDSSSLRHTIESHGKHEEKAVAMSIPPGGSKIEEDEADENGSNGEQDDDSERTNSFEA